MAKKSNYKTPGVYVEEIKKSPPSIPQRSTDIAGFVGYTEQAFHNGAPCFFKPIKITSPGEFEQIFTIKNTPNFQRRQAVEFPLFHVWEIPASTTAGDPIAFNRKKISVQPDPSTLYYLRQSIQLFFANGGKSTYVVSVGKYGKATHTPAVPNTPLINPNIKLADLEKGLSSLATIEEISLYVIPDASLLPRAEAGNLHRAMLTQCKNLRSVFSIIDVPGGKNPKDTTWENEIAEFRANIGATNLERGAAYFPFIQTTINASDQLNYQRINNGKVDALRNLIFPKRMASDTLLQFENIANGINKSPQVNEQLLQRISKPYRKLLDIINTRVNTVPPSGAVAGVYARVDSQRGVWKAPANENLLRTSGLTFKITDHQQTGLNVDPIEGKSINAIRNFTGKGILVWGARTLAGNDNEWRYIPVRRLAILIDQSCQKGLSQFVFEPNDANTWVRVKSTVENFLTLLWRQGAFQGATPEEAFFVKVGLGETMTAQDILEGRLIVEIGFAAVRPAEFIILRWIFKMQPS